MSDEDDEFLYSDEEAAGEEEDEEAVDWEDVEPSTASVDVAAAPSEHEQEAPPTSETELTTELESQETKDDIQEADQVPSNLHAVDWEQVNRSLEQEAKAESGKKRRRKAVRMSRGDLDREVALHEAHLLVLLALHLRWNTLCESPLLRGLLLSLTAGSAVDFLSDGSTGQPLAYSLELLVRWFRDEFSVQTSVVDEDEDEDAGMLQTELLTESRLLAIFFARKGVEFEFAVLFTALTRALGLRCRYVCALDPMVVRTNSAFNRQQQQQRSTQRASSQVLRNRLQAALNGEPEPQPGDEEVAKPSFWLWTEVLDEKTKTWVAVDVIHRLVARPRAIEPLRGKGAPFTYVVAIRETGRVLDVTPRYATAWSKSLPLRLADAWMEVALDEINSMQRPQQPADHERDAVSGRLSFAMVDWLVADELRQLEDMKTAEAMPGTLEAFKKHHVYCLERHLGRLECIHPRTAVGVFNGELVFRRGDVQSVQSAFKWRRLGRQVLESERATPAKWYAPRGSSSGRKRAPGDDDEDSDVDVGGQGGSKSLALFGRWQTTEVVPPAVVDGVLPKNQYGNLEIWSPAHVPRGAVHVRLPRIEQVARQLGIDYAAAVVGFETQNGRTMPQFDGIVVAQHLEAALLDGHADIQQVTIEKAIAKNQRITIKRWERLVKRLLLRQRLEDDYGAV